METNTFFSANEIGITITSASMQYVTLGTVPEFHLSSDNNKGCGNAYDEALSVKNYFTTAAPAPQFIGILLGFSFALLVLQLLWLAVYYSIPLWLSQKNIFTFGISIIELVIIGFIYSNNNELFRLEKLTQTLKQCLEEQVPALKQWDFGIESPQAFQMLLFVNTAYLGLYISALLYDHFCLQPYKRQQVLLPLGPALQWQSLLLLLYAGVLVLQSEYLICNLMFTVVENVLEALYVYQLSFYFKIHLVVVVAGILCIIWLFILECRIKNQESDPKTNKCSEKVDYFNYVVNKQKNTEEAVRQLQETP